MSKKRELPPRPINKKEISTRKASTKKVSTEKLVEESLNDKIDENLPKPKNVRKKPTIEGHIENYTKALSILDLEIDRKSREKEKGVRSLKKVRKIILKMRKELSVVARSKAAKLKTNSGKMGGIMIGCSISEELADFLQVPHDTKLSRVEITRAICTYSHLKDDEKRESVLHWAYLNPNGRNLQNPLDKKAILPDKALSKLLRYDQYKKDVKAGKIMRNMKDKETGKIIQVKMSDDMLYYWVIQKLLGIHFLKE